MLEKMIALIGKTINEEEIKQFIEENGLKYPKKDTISSKADSQYYSVVGNKQGLELAFGIDDSNPFINPKPAEKKGRYYPNLTTIWIRAKSKIVLPFGLDYNMEYDDVVPLIGEATHKSSDNMYYAVETGKELFYSWEIPANKDKSVFYTIRVFSKEIEFSITTENYRDIFKLYEPLLEEPFCNMSKPSNASIFIEWAIKKGFFRESAENKAGIDKVKNGEIEGHEFISQYVKHPAIYLHDFTKDIYRFALQYTRNSGGNDIWYNTDFIFLYEKLGEIKPEEVMKVIEQRYQEFEKYRWFAKSKQLGEISSIFNYMGKDFIVP